MQKTKDLADVKNFKSYIENLKKKKSHDHKYRTLSDMVDICDYAIEQLNKVLEQIHKEEKIIKSDEFYKSANNSNRGKIMARQYMGFAYPGLFYYIDKADTLDESYKKKVVTDKIKQLIENASLNVDSEFNKIIDKINSTHQESVIMIGDRQIPDFIAKLTHCNVESPFCFQGWGLLNIAEAEFAFNDFETYDIPYLHMSRLFETLNPWTELSFKMLNKKEKKEMPSKHLVKSPVEKPTTTTMMLLFDEQISVEPMESKQQENEENKTGINIFETQETNVLEEEEIQEKEEEQEEEQEEEEEEEEQSGQQQQEQEQEEEEEEEESEHEEEEEEEEEEEQREEEGQLFLKEEQLKITLINKSDKSDWPSMAEEQEETHEEKNIGLFESLLSKQSHEIEWPLMSETEQEESEKRLLQPEKISPIKINKPLMPEKMINRSSIEQHHSRARVVANISKDVTAPKRIEKAIKFEYDFKDTRYEENISINQDGDIICDTIEIGRSNEMTKYITPVSEKKEFSSYFTLKDNKQDESINGRIQISEKLSPHNKKLMETWNSRFKK
jgi:flagellar biosynthesis GTPase FlhF